MKKPIGPEKMVEIEVLSKAKELGFDLDVIDSKATYSQSLQRYRKGKHAPEGFPDLVGNDDKGRAVFIELKAKGRLSTLRPSQRAFLERKIQQGCFACVIDSSEGLFRMYLGWREKGSQFLMESLQSQI